MFDILLLALLDHEPSHGYQLKQRAERVFGRDVLNNNTLYPLLRRFQEAGAVTVRVGPQEGKPARHVYEITSIGQELLHDLLVDFPESVAASGQEFLTRVSFFGLLNPQERLAILDARERALQAQLDRATGSADSARRDQWNGRVLDELAARIEREQSWVVSLRAQASN
jgi:DNA-binding PadR family transcriptional regulator